MPKILEIIVTSVEEAREAEAGGADRLELVSNFAVGGLTPELRVVEDVLAKVRIPIRVMLRDMPTLHISGPHELERLAGQAAQFAALPIDGLVLGFADESRLDLSSTRALLNCAPGLRATFHRAFEEDSDPLHAIEQLRALPQIDRILTRGGKGGWPERSQRLNLWQKAAGSELKVLVGIGLCACTLAGLRNEPFLKEAHAGRAARFPTSVQGQLRSEQVSALKSALG
jgi:copper homeostasis protein